MGNKEEQKQEEGLSAEIQREEQSRIIREKDELFQDVQQKVDSYGKQEDKRRLDLSDLMHHQYITRKQAQEWIRIEGSSGLTILEELLQLYIKKCEKLKNVRSIVDNGSGSGKKSALVYQAFNPGKNGENGRLHLLDLSDEILINARNYCTTAGIRSGNIPVHHPVAFQNLGKIDKITKDLYYRLHLLLGQTLGNFDDPVEILRRIGINMRKGEYLLLEWFCRKPEDYNKTEFEDLYRILFSGIGIPQKAIGGYNPHLELDEEKREWNVMSFTVQDVPEAERSFMLKGEKHTLRPGTEIVVSRSRRFKEEEVIGLCRQAGLEGVVVDEWSENTWDGEGVSPEKFERRWVARGDRRYGLFKKKGPSVMPKIIAAGGMAILGTLVSAMLFEPERTDICVYQDSAYRTLACVDKGTGERIESHLADITLEAAVSEANRKGFIVNMKKKRYFLSTETDDVHKLKKLHDKLTDLIAITEIRKRSDGSNCNEKTLRFLKETKASNNEGDPEEMLNNILNFAGAHYAYLADCSGEDRKIAIDSLAFWRLYADVSQSKHFSPTYQAFVYDQLLESHLRKDKEATKLLMKAFTDQRVLKAFSKASYFNFKKLPYQKPIFGLQENEGMTDTFIITLNTPKWYTLKEDRGYTSEKHMVDFIDRLVRSKNELVLEAGINFIERYGNNFASVVENGALLGALIRAGDYATGKVYAGLIKLGTSLISVPHSSYILMYLAEVAEEIQRDKSQKRIDGFSDIPEGRLFVSAVDGFNELRYHDVVYPHIYGALQRIPENGNLREYLNDLALFVQSINRHSCIQEHLKRCHEKKDDCAGYFERLVDADIWGEKFKQLALLLKNPFDEDKLRDNADRPFNERSAEIDSENFPYKYDLCDR